MEFKLQSFDICVNVEKIANVHYFEFTNHYHTKEDCHNFWELLYIDKEMLEVSSESYTGVLSENQIIIHKPGEKHSLCSLDSTAPNVIIIGFKCDCDELLFFSEKPVTLLPEHIKLLAKILNEGMNVYEPPYDIPNTYAMKKRENYVFGADQMLKMSLEIFLISILRDFKFSPVLSHKDEPLGNVNIDEVHRYITENYKTKIALDNICFIFGTNKTTLCKNFKTEYGITILNYVNSLRIKEAKNLLRKNKMSVTEISEAVGFESVHYFCRAFKKAEKQSPTHYVKTIKSKLDL